MTRRGAKGTHARPPIRDEHQPQPPRRQLRIPDRAAILAASAAVPAAVAVHRWLAR